MTVRKNSRGAVLYYFSTPKNRSYSSLLFPWFCSWWHFFLDWDCCCGSSSLGSSNEHALSGSLHKFTILWIVEKLSQLILNDALKIALLSLYNINRRIPYRIVQWCRIVGRHEQSRHHGRQGLDHYACRNEITGQLGQLRVTECGRIPGNLVGTNHAVARSNSNATTTTLRLGGRPFPILATPIGVFRPDEIIVSLPLQLLSCFLLEWGVSQCHGIVGNVVIDLCQDTLESIREL